MQTQHNFIVTHNFKISDEYHTTDIVCAFTNRDDAINYVTEMNCDREEGDNWYQYVELEVH